MANGKRRAPKAAALAAPDHITKFTIRELGLLDLNEQPFSISADPRFLYFNRTT